MPKDKSDLQALRNLISEADLLLSTTTLPEGRAQRAHELLSAALQLADALVETRVRVRPAVALGRKGGAATAQKHGSEYFRQLAARRKTRAGGRPKSTGEDKAI